MSRPFRAFAHALPLLALAIAMPAQAQKRIALSFDDVPRSRGPFLTPDERTAKLIASLKKARVKQVVFYVNPGQIGTGDGINGEAHIAAYVRAGHVIGDHSWAHKGLQTLDAEAFIGEIDKAEAWLKRQPGYRPWFRYPYLYEGGKDAAKRDAVRAAMQARGLQDGYATASGSDWNTEQLLIDAVKAGKPIDRDALCRFYIDTHLHAADFSDALMRKAIGRAPIQVMLMHETDLDALYLPDLVEALRKHGWEIVPIERAYADPVHLRAPETRAANGTLSEMLAADKGIAHDDPDWNPPGVNRRFAEQVLHEAAQ